MFNRARSFTYQLANNMKRIGSTEALSPMSLILILFLDLFVLSTIMNGLDAHQSQLRSPSDVVPYICRDIVINNNWVEDNRLNLLTRQVRAYQTAIYNNSGIEKQIHPICQPILQALKAIKANKALAKQFAERDTLNKKYQAYDNYQKEHFPEAKNYVLKLRELDQSLSTEPDVKHFITRLEAGLAQQSHLVNDLKKINFIYPLKRFVSELVFLVPIFIVFAFWYQRSVRADKQLQAFLSAHMLVISFLPIFFNICELVYDLIPKYLFEKLLALLHALNLIGLWYYLLIILAVLATCAAIYIIQKKLFNQARVQQQRVSRGQCMACAVKLVGNCQHCPYCGTSLVNQCASCKHDVLLGVPYCSHCGCKRVVE